MWIVDTNGSTLNGTLVSGNVAARDATGAWLDYWADVNKALETEDEIFEAIGSLDPVLEAFASVVVKAHQWYQAWVNDMADEDYDSAEPASGGGLFVGGVLALNGSTSIIGNGVRVPTALRLAESTTAAASRSRRGRPCRPARRRRARSGPASSPRTR